MESLYQYFEQIKWSDFISHVKKEGFEKNVSFYEDLKSKNIFPDDINIVLTSLYDYMFYSKKEVFEKWASTPKKMLDNKTPLKSVENENDCNSLREYLMRCP